MDAPDESARDRPDPAAPPPDAARASQPPLEEECDVCGSTDVWWRNCKLLCRNCGAIVKSCADL